MEHKTSRVVAIRPPTQSTTPGVGVTRLATSVTATPHDLTIGGTSTRFFGKRLRIVNEDASIAIWLAFGDAATPLISSATAGGTTIALGTVEENGFKLVAGSAIEVRLSLPTHKYLYLQAASGTPVVAIYPESPGINGT
jgi:hypothetical protein